MTFEQALKAMREGKRVRQRCWNLWEAMWMFNGKLFWYDNPDLDVGEVEYLLVSFILDEDWEIVK